MEIDINVQVELRSLTGVVHRICRTGIYTNNVFRPFERPIPLEIDKAGTSSSGSFIYIISHGKLFLITAFQSKLDIDGIDYSEAFFFDAAFSNEENMLITLADDLRLVLFEIHPPKPICHKYIVLPNQPVSFKYFQLQNRLEFEIDNIIYAFKFPNLFNANGSPNLEFIPSVPFEEIQDFIINEEVNEICQNSNGSQYGFQTKSANQTILEISKQILNKGKSLSKRQNSIKSRYDALNSRAEQVEALSGHIKKELMQVQTKIEEQARKILTLISSADEYAGKLLEIPDSLETLFDIINDIICDDDVINHDQETEFHSFQLLERIQELEHKFV